MIFINEEHPVVPTLTFKRMRLHAKDFHLGGRAMRKQEAKITEEQIQKALRRFKLMGGKIERIPDQVTPRIFWARSKADSFSGALQVGASAVAEVARPMSE